MTVPRRPRTIIQGLSMGARAVAAEWGASPVAGILFASPREGLEVFLRHDLSLELCGALSRGCGLDLLRWAGRSPGVHLLRRETLASTAPAVHRIMAGDGLDGLALLPILGERSVLGYFVVGLHEGDQTRFRVDNGRMGALKAFNRWLGGIRHEAGLVALQSLLALQEKGVGQDVRGLVVLDSDDRILLSHGVSRILPTWGGGEVTGQALKTLPAGRVLASIDPVGSGHLDWRNRKSPVRDGDSTFALAALPVQSAKGERLPWRLVLIRGQERGVRSQEGGVLLELALRLTLDPGGSEEGDSARQTDSLIRSALVTSDRIQAEEPIDLSGMFRGFLRRLEPELQDDRIRVLPFLNDGLPLVRANRRALDTALWALLQTAWMSLIPRGGTITLRTWEEEGSMWCTISSDGEGARDSSLMEMLALEPIWNPGGEAHLPRGGLAMAEALLKRSGGVFHLETRQGLWTRYSVVFPAERVIRDPQEQDRQGIPPAVEVRKTRDGGMAVLVVDDNQMVRTVLRRYLERSGHEVMEAVDGSVALAMLHERAFDRVMVDIDMPGTSGVEFFRQLDSVNPVMRDRTVFMTGGFQETDTEDFIKGTGRPHLQKPFDLKQIGEVLFT